MKTIQRARRALRFSTALVGCFLSAWVAAAPPPVEDFSRSPVIDDVKVSPTGKRLALLVQGDDGFRRLAVMNLSPVSKPRIVGAVREADVETVEWVTDERLVYVAYRRLAEVTELGSGTFAVNHDGSDQLQLILWSRENTTGTHIASRVLPYGWDLHSAAGDGSDDVIVYKQVHDDLGDPTEIQFARLNTQTRRLRNLSQGLPEFTQNVVFDAANEPRVATTHRKGLSKVHWRAKPGGEWKLLAEFDPLKAGFVPRHITDDGQLLVSANMEGTDALYKLDPVSGKLDPNPLVKLGGFDLHPNFEIDSRTRRAVGFHFVADRPMSYWFDEHLQRIQKSLDAALPEGRSNRLYCGECETTQFFVIRSSSDRQPGEYFLYDRKNSTLELIGAARPWIQEAAQGRRSFHRYEARDGLKVPIVVTHPPGAALDKPLPTVLLVHGGPWVRGGNLTWEDEAQFLASRGYRVLAPEFRGSTGFGAQHFEAGWKQWGGTMQHDLTDAVQWGIKQGLVDGKRVCIMGASYGGYAALMSPIVNPALYRCAVSFAGVSDLPLMLSEGWSDITGEGLRYGMPALLGDPDKDAERLAAESPIKRVAEIKLPVLLVHGALDRRVPIVHSRRFASAAENAGVKVESVYYPDEGHGLLHPTNRTDFLQRVERFLKTSLSDGN